MSVIVLQINLIMTQPFISVQNVLMTPFIMGKVISVRVPSLNHLDLHPTCVPLKHLFTTKVPRNVLSVQRQNQFLIQHPEPVKVVHLTDQVLTLIQKHVNYALKRSHFTISHNKNVNHAQKQHQIITKQLKYAKNVPKKSPFTIKLCLHV